MMGKTFVPANALGAYRYSAAVMMVWNVIAAALVGAYAMREGRSSRRCVQFVLFLAGWGVAFVYASLGYLHAFQNDFYPSYMGIVWSFFPLAIGLGILRFTLFDIKLVLRRTLPYALGMALIGGLYAGFIGALGYAMQAPLAEMGGLQFVLLLLIMGVTFQPVTEALRSLLDRLLFRRETRMNALLARTGHELSTCETMADVAETALRHVRTALAPESAGAVLADRHERVCLDVAAGLRDKEWFERDWDALAGSATIQRIVEPGGWVELPAAENRQVQRMREAGYHRAVRLCTESARGLLLLGEKKSHMVFSGHDEEFLVALAAQIELSLDRLHEKRQAKRARSLAENLVEAAPVFVAVTDARGRIEERNSSFAAMFGAPDGSTLSDVGLGVLQAGLGRRETREIVVGERHFLGVKATLAEEDDRALIILTDVTQLRRMQEVARRQEVLAELGVLISSINHEIDNILAPIPYNLKRLKESAAHAGEQKHALRLEKGFQRLQGLTHELRQFYKDPVLEVRQVTLAVVLSSLLSDLEVLFREQGAVWRPAVVTGGETELRADPQKLRQVLLNLLKNAYESMRPDAPGEWGLCAHTEGEKAVVSVFDSGEGMSEKERQRLFEPFFSTKGDRGTGLGMAVVRRIVEAHGACIHVDSARGRGTRITLCWPRSSRWAAPEVTDGGEGPRIGRTGALER